MWEQQTRQALSDHYTTERRALQEVTREVPETRAQPSALAACLVRLTALFPLSLSFLLMFVWGVCCFVFAART